MPTDTQRAPTLSQCIEREREAEDDYRNRSIYDDAETEDYALGTMERARTATDEAVRAVEAEVERLRAVNADLLSKWQASESRHVQTAGTHIQAIADLKRINEKLAVLSRRLIGDPAPTAQGDSTGGESDE